MAERYDVVVVGGGTSGCVLAARLSADPERRVLLLESGPDHGSVSGLPDDLRSARTPAFSHDWGFRSEAVAGRRSVRLPRAMVTGGCSATNAAVAVRGAPADYERWVELGATGWSWAEVLPWFRTLERDLDFADDWHGNDGPVPIRRCRTDELTELHAAVLRGAVDAGHASVEDHNRPGAVGVGPAPMNAIDGVRVSAAMAYLWPAADRANLTVRANELVSTLTPGTDGITGVELASGERIGSDTVVLAAGAYCSPGILLRSGIGATDVLAPLGIDVLLDLPAVGENLQDHPILPLAWAAPTDAAGGPIFQSLVTLAPNDGGAPTMQLIPASGPAPASGASSRRWFLTTALVKPASRGRVRLSSRDPVAGLQIDIGHLADDADVDKLRRVVEAARQVAATDALRSLTSGGEIGGVPAFDADDFASAARQLVTTYHHPTGTCAMGDDPSRSVVDASGRVHGLPNLFIADASVMPEIPSAPTNLATMMIAERLAHVLRTM